MGYTLGLDIGISSIGFGLIDVENQQIVLSGVRLFNKGNSDKTQERRGYRSARRLIRRRKHRLTRLKELLKANGIEFPKQQQSVCPYEMRVKGLTQPLTKDELCVALYQLVKHRGISCFEDMELDEGDSTYAQSLSKNGELLKEKHPCEIQLERLKTYGKTRGQFTVKTESGEDVVLMNVFPTSAYEKEARAILNRQSQEHPELTEAFVEDCLEILTRKREYYIGPGNEKSRTDYGIYRTNGETWDDLYEHLIGACSLFPDKKRSAKFSKTAQEYNLLNDLNNLTVKGEKLTRKQKELIYQTVNDLTIKKISMIQIIAKIAECKKEEIAGYTVDTNKKPVISSMSQYRSFRKHVLEQTGFDMETLDIELFDELAKKMTLNGTASVVRKTLNDLQLGLSDTVIEAIVEYRKTKAKEFNGWHSFSLDALDCLIPELWETSENQMQVISRLKLSGQGVIEFKKNSKLPVGKVVSQITNPVVKTSVRESLKIVNEVIRQYGALDNIVIELAREYNNDFDVKLIKKKQEESEKFKKIALTQARKDYPFTEEVYAKQINFDLKVRLWHEQNGKCPYSGKPISIKDLVYQPSLFEIDHIIPKSISFDNSLNNKVLCYAIENQRKGQRSPFEYLTSSISPRSFSEFESDILAMKNMSAKKQSLLLFEEPLSKYDVRLGFRNRNLVDTRYATRFVLNTLQDYFKSQGNQTKVASIKGSFTAHLRRRWGILKDREESFHHHAEDAIIVAIAPYLGLFKRYPIFHEDDYQATHRSLSLLNSKEYQTWLYELPYEDFPLQLEQAMKECRFSHKKDSKVNRSLSDNTIYGVRNGYLPSAKEKIQGYQPNKSDARRVTIKKIKNIYEDMSTTGSKKECTFMKIYRKDKTKFLMYHQDPQTFALIEDIIKMYPDEPNPLEAYRKEYGVLLKYSKKGNGTPIYSMKYADKNLNSCMEVNHEGGRSSVKLKIEPFRADVYYNVNTQKYTCVGLKHADLKFQKGSGKYGISLADYQSILTTNKIDLTIDELKLFQLDKTQRQTESGFIFCFSLYRNDTFELRTINGDIQQARLLSCDIDGNLKYKPLHQEVRETKKSVRQFEQLKKYRVDVIGKTYPVYRETLMLNFE